MIIASSIIRGMVAICKTFRTISDIALSTILNPRYRDGRCHDVSHAHDSLRRGKKAGRWSVAELLYVECKRACRADPGAGSRAAILVCPRLPSQHHPVPDFPNDGKLGQTGQSFRHVHRVSHSNKEFSQGGGSTRSRIAVITRRDAQLSIPRIRSCLNTGEPAWESTPRSEDIPG